MQNKTCSQKEFHIKARKRQFDSRWRANIAGCFETLLQIIPINKRAIKKQSKVFFYTRHKCILLRLLFLKAQILASTINHMDFLEKTYVRLLHQKAKILETTSESEWCSDEFSKMEKQFIDRELNKQRKPTQLTVKPKKISFESKNFHYNKENVYPIDIETPQNFSNKIVFSANKQSDDGSTFESNEVLDCFKSNETDDEVSTISASLEKTPQNTGKSFKYIVVAPIKRKRKITSPFPRKCRKSLMITDDSLNDKENTQEVTELKHLMCEEHDLDTKINKEDPWLVTDVLQRFKRPILTSKNHSFNSLPSNDFLPLMDPFEENEYAGRNSPLFSFDFPCNQVTENSEWD